MVLEVPSGVPKIPTVDSKMFIPELGRVTCPVLSPVENHEDTDQMYHTNSTSWLLKQFSDFLNEWCVLTCHVRFLVVFVVRFSPETI